MDVNELYLILPSLILVYLRLQCNCSGVIKPLQPKIVYHQVACVAFATAAFGCSGD